MDLNVVGDVTSLKCLKTGSGGMVLPINGLEGVAASLVVSVRAGLVASKGTGHLRTWSKPCQNPSGKQGETTAVFVSLETSMGSGQCLTTCNGFDVPSLH